MLVISRECHSKIQYILIKYNAFEILWKIEKILSYLIILVLLLTFKSKIERNLVLFWKFSVIFDNSLKIRKNIVIFDNFFYGNLILTLMVGFYIPIWKKTSDKKWSLTEDAQASSCCLVYIFGIFFVLLSWL